MSKPSGNVSSSTVRHLSTDKKWTSICLHLRFKVRLNAPLVIPSIASDICNEPQMINLKPEYYQNITKYHNVDKDSMRKENYVL
jgi:hypothetical protein